MQLGPVSDQTSVLKALQDAAAATGSDFHYLLGTAMRESSLKPLAQSHTSSALGLFQFVDQTWLGLVKQHGDKYGLGAMAAQIEKDGDHYSCADPAARQAILALRKNPQVSAFMAGEYATATASQMKASLGRKVCGGELYAAHFLGPDAACKLIRLNDSQPGGNAATLFPGAAGANKSVFFHADGAPRTVREVYDWAMRQPGAPAQMPAAAPLPAMTAPAVSVPKASVAAAAAINQNIESLMQGLMNWQPAGFFSSGNTNADVAAPLTLGPGLLDILSSQA